MSWLRFFNPQIKTFSIIVIGVILLTACTNNTFDLTPEIPTPSPPSSTLAPSLTPTATLTPTLPGTPTPTSTVTATPTTTATPLPWSQTSISVDNASQLALLTRWGQGTLIWSELVGKERVIVKSTTGIYLFNYPDTQLLAEYIGAVKYEISPDQKIIAILFPDAVINIILVYDASVINTFSPQSTIPEYVCEDCDEYTLQSMISAAAERTSMVFSRDGRYLACGYADRSIGVWDIETGELKATLYHDVAGNASQIHFTPDGNHIVSSGYSLFECCSRTRITYWSVETKELLWYLNESGSLDPILFSPDNNIIGLYYSPPGGRSAVVRLYDTQDGKLINQINGVAGNHPYTPDSSLFVTTRGGNVQIERVQPNFVHLWTIYTDLESATAEFSTDGSQIIVNGGEKVYSIPDFKLISEGAPRSQETANIPIGDESHWLALGFGDLPRGLIISPDSQIYLWGGINPVWRWNPLTKRMDWIDLPSEPIANPAISSDGTKIANCYSDRLEVQSFEGDQLTIPVTCFPRSVLAFVPGKDILAVGHRNKITSYDLSSGEHIQDFIGGGIPVSWLDFSAKGNLFASGGRNGDHGDQFLWQLEPARGISLVPEGSDKAVNDVAFTHDEAWMISTKGYTWVWETSSGLQKGKISLFGNILAISPDDKLLAVSDGNVISIVSLETRQIVTSFRSHEDGIIALDFTLDGANLVSLGFNGSIEVWGVP